jgi:hypothetical protein
MCVRSSLLNGSNDEGPLPVFLPRVFGLDLTKVTDSPGETTDRGQGRGRDVEMDLGGPSRTCGWRSRRIPDRGGQIAQPTLQLAEHGGAAPASTSKGLKWLEPGRGKLHISNEGRHLSGPLAGKRYQQLYAEASPSEARRAFHCHPDPPDLSPSIRRPLCLTFHRSPTSL